jgi:hypothetical protein
LTKLLEFTGRYVPIWAIIAGSIVVSLVIFFVLLRKQTKTEAVAQVQKKRD